MHPFLGLIITAFLSQAITYAHIAAVRSSRCDAASVWATSNSVADVNSDVVFDGDDLGILPVRWEPRE